MMDNSPREHFGGEGTLRGCARVPLRSRFLAPAFHCTLVSLRLRFLHLFFLLIPLHCC